MLLHLGSVAPDSVEGMKIGSIKYFEVLIKVLEVIVLSA
jgi:hypothetical protein